MADLRFDGATVVRPGDTLVLRLAPLISDDEYETIKAHVERELPGVRCMIMAGVDQVMIYRTEETL